MQGTMRSIVAAIAQPPDSNLMGQWATLRNSSFRRMGEFIELAPPKVDIAKPTDNWPRLTRQAVMACAPRER